MLCIKCHYDLRGNTSGTCPECGQAFDPQDPASYLTHVWSSHWVHRVVGASLLVLLLAWAAMSGGSVGWLLDIPSLIWVGGVLCGGLWFSFGPGTVCGAIGATLQPRRSLNRDQAGLYLRVWAVAYQLSWAAGLIGTTLSMVIMLRYLDDPAAIGSGMAIALMVVLYGAGLAEFVIMPMWHVLANRVPQVNHPELLALTPNRSLMGFGFALVFLMLLLFAIGLLTFSPM